MNVTIVLYPHVIVMSCMAVMLMVVIESLHVVLMFPLSCDKRVQVSGGVAGRVHLIGGVEGGEVDLKLVVVFPIELHLFKPVTPQDLTWQI